jgi:hypothetical protein
MSAPLHSLPPPRSAGEAYDERNNFLYLVLGLVSLAEQTLSTLTELGEAPAIREADASPGASSTHGSVLR